MHCNQLTPSSKLFQQVPYWSTQPCAHTLKSNNPVQFNNKAAAGEGNQSFPLTMTRRQTQTPRLRTVVHLWSMCVGAR